MTPDATGKDRDTAESVVAGPGVQHLTLEAEEDLRREEQIQRHFARQRAAILNAIPAHIALLDTDGIIIEVNQAWNRFAVANELVSAKFCVGQNYINICRNARGNCSEEAAEAAEGILSVLQGKSVEFALEYPCHSPNEYRWFRLVVSPLEDDRLAGAVVMHVNITDRKLAEIELREREHLLSNAQRIGKMGSWRMDLVNNRLYWPEETCRLFGLEPSQFAGTFEHFYSMILPEDRHIQDESQSRALAGEGILEAEYRIRKVDGEIRWLYERGIVERDAKGTPVRRLGMAMDITDRKTSELRLAEQAALLDQTNDAILVRDLKNTVLYWSRGAERVYGWTAEEILGKPILDFLSDNPAVFNAATAVVLETGEWQGELERNTKSRGQITVFARWTLMRDEPGKPKSILQISADITQRKRLEQQFLRTQRLESIGTLAGGIAHDLNNILAPILVSSDLLESEVQSRDGQELLERVKRNALRGSELIKQVLGFARGVEGKRIQVSPLSVAREVYRMIQETFPKGINVELRADPNIWGLEADPTQLYQVLMNLCVNARDAMPSGGKLLLRLENLLADEVFTKMHTQAKPGPYVVLRVEDTGLGMTKEVQDRVFEPFFTTKELGKGTGLGLSTVFSIVRDNDGFLSLYSEPGKGTEFKIYWPASLSGEPPPDLPEEDSLPHGNGELILIVDDEENIREITRRALERSGFRVIVASNGAEGIKSFVQNSRDVAAVLTDISMPVMDGPSMMVALRAIDPDVPIVASSGLTSSSEIAKVSGEGIVHFIPKPYTSKTLLNMLHAVLAPAGRATSAQKDPTYSSPAQPPAISAATSPDAAHKNTGDTILLVDDEILITSLYSRMIESMGHKVLAANSVEQALRHIELHRDQLFLAIIDLHMPGQNGDKLLAPLRDVDARGRYIPAVIFAGNVSDAERQRCIAAGADGFLDKPASATQVKAFLKRWQGPLEARPAPEVLSEFVVEGKAVYADPILDVKVLADLVGSEPAVIERFLRAFLETAQDGNAKLSAATNAGDAKAAGDIAHKLKSAARSVGAAALGNCYQGIESAAAEGDAAKIRSLLSDLKKQLAAVEIEISNSLRRP